MDMMNDLMAQTYASNVKWPKDQILAIRVEHIVKCIKDGKFPVQEGHSLGQILAELQDNDDTPFDSKSPDSNLRESLTPLSEISAEGKPNNPHQGLSPQQQQNIQQKIPQIVNVNKDGTTVVESTSKIRQLLTQALPTKPLPPGSNLGSIVDIEVEDDPIARLAKNRGISGIEITPVNGDASETSSLIADLQRKAATNPAKPPSKLESALDKLGMQNKRKLSEGTNEDKSKKKKRLDDIMFGLGAAKGVTLEKDEPVAPGQSLLKKATDPSSVGKIPDLNKLQDLLGRPDSPSEAKVNKVLDIQ